MMLNIDELKKIYNNKKVLVTGHTGFKGSYMCVLLKYLGAKVYGYSLKPEKNGLYELLNEGTKQLVTAEIFADIRDGKKLIEFVKSVNPNFILHMAAQPLVLYGYEEPKYTYEVNVMGTINLFEAIRNVYQNKRNKTPLSVLNVTTDKVYENNDLPNYAFKETDKLCGRDPYANSKSCSELVTYAYNKSFFQDKNLYRISTARAGNVLGGGDLNKNRIIPDCYRAIKNKKSLIIKNPSSIRPYQFVLEPLILYLNIMAMQLKNVKFAGNYNIGPDKKDCLTTKMIVEKFYKAWIAPHSVAYEMRTRKSKNHEAKFLRLDNKLIKKVFNYKQIFTMNDTMKFTVEIYQDMLLKNNIYESIVNVIKMLK